MSTATMQTAVKMSYTERPPRGRRDQLWRLTTRQLGASIARARRVRSKVMNGRSVSKRADGNGLSLREGVADAATASCSYRLD
jgi:hypothetical protein